MTAGEWTVTEPGVVHGMPHDVYHSDPVPAGSLSSTGARRLLPPSCPAKFDHERRNGTVPTKALELGSAAHDELLGRGPDIVVVQRTAKDGTKSDADNYQTKSAQEHRDAIREAGGVPLLRSERDQIEAMIVALRAHPLASRLFADGHGQSEVSAFARDEQTGSWLRSRFDWLPDKRGRRLIIPDYKTAVCAQQDEWARSAARYGYPQQQAFYTDVAKALGLDDEPAFLFVVQEKTAPFLVNVIQLDVVAVQVGRERNRRAIDLFTRCTETGQWPSYSDRVEVVSLPAWFENQLGDVA